MFVCNCYTPSDIDHNKLIIISNHTWATVLPHNAPAAQYWWLHYVLTTSTLYTHPFNGPLSGTTRVSQYQKGKTNLDFTEARDNEWQWHQLGCMQGCTTLQTDNHASTTPLSFLQVGCPSCHPTNSVKALKPKRAPCRSLIL